jgi:hypothetical protein
MASAPSCCYTLLLLLPLDLLLLSAQPTALRLQLQMKLPPGLWASLQLEVAQQQQLLLLPLGLRATPQAPVVTGRCSLYGALQAAAHRQDQAAQHAAAGAAVVASLGRCCSRCCAV